MKRPPEHKEYVPIHAAKWELKIERGIMHEKHYFWMLRTNDQVGFGSAYSRFMFEGGCFTPQGAYEDFKHFAEINNINLENVTVYASKEIIEALEKEQEK